MGTVLLVSCALAAGGGALTDALLSPSVVHANARCDADKARDRAEDRQEASSTDTAGDVSEDSSEESSQRQTRHADCHPGHRPAPSASPMPAPPPMPVTTTVTTITSSVSAASVTRHLSVARPASGVAAIPRTGAEDDLLLGVVLAASGVGVIVGGRLCRRRRA